MDRTRRGISYTGPLLSKSPGPLKIVSPPLFFPPDQRPDPEALMSELEVFRSHLTDHHYNNVRDISDAGRIAEEQTSVFPLANKTYRLALTA